MSLPAFIKLECWWRGLAHYAASVSLSVPASAELRIARYFRITNPELTTRFRLFPSFDYGESLNQLLQYQDIWFRLFPSS